MSNQLQVTAGANILGGLTVTGGINADSILQNGQPVGGSVSTDATLTGNGTVGSPLHAVIPVSSVNGRTGTVVVGELSTDSVLQIANSVSTMVNSLELVNSLLVNTSGAETGRWLIKTILAGTAGVTAIDIRGSQTLFPTGSAALPGVSFQGSFNGYGMAVDTVGSNLTLSANGVYCAIFNTSGHMTINKDAGAILIGSVSQIYLGANGLALQLYSNLGDVELGVDGAVATTATTGFVQYPSCAGTPTGVPAQIKSGHVPTMFDTTAGKMWAYYGSAWHFSTFT